MKKRVLALLGLALSTPSWGLDTRYFNEQFRFAANIPDGLRACPHVPPAPNPGFIVPLSSQGCASPLEGSFLAVVGEYNTSSFRRTQDAAVELCAGSTPRPSNTHPTIRFYTCEQQLAADEILIRYIALRLTPAPDWPLHGYIYTISLQCRPADCDRYGPLFRQTVASMRFR